MPKYDYRCMVCEYPFEKHLAYSDSDGKFEVVECPKCGSKLTIRVVVPPAVIFKGKGFYKNDVRRTSGEVD